MKKIIYTQSVLIHQLIRKMIYRFDYIKTIKLLKEEIYDSMWIEEYKYRLSIRNINKILKYIANEDSKHNIVSSCISITILAYLLCDFANIESKIIIGVALVNQKVLSHS